MLFISLTRSTNSKKYSLFTISKASVIELVRLATIFDDSTGNPVSIISSSIIFLFKELNWRTCDLEIIVGKILLIFELVKTA